ncbi:MAG: plastocyanin/azurin family copper-binding protein [Salinirussus sp.]
MRLSRRQLLHATAASSLALAGCGGGGDGGDGGGGGGDNGEDEASPTSTPTPAGETVDKTIVMKNTAFQTLKAEVETGATVEWVNKDGFAHTVTSSQFHDTAKSWSLDKEVSGGGSITHTFDTKGVYEYYCTIHGKGTMCGAILVGGASLGKSLPCSGDGGGGYGGDSGY